MFRAGQATPIRGSNRRLLLGRSASFTPGSPGKTRPVGAAEEDHTLLASHERRSPAADRNGCKVRIPAHAQSQGQARLTPIFVVHVRIPPAQPWMSASSPLPASKDDMYPEQPVRKSIAGVAAAEAMMASAG